MEHQCYKQKQGEKFREWSQRLLMETKVQEWKDHELLAMYHIIQDEVIHRAKRIIYEDTSHNKSEE